MVRQRHFRFAAGGAYGNPPGASLLCFDAVYTWVRQVAAVGTVLPFGPLTKEPLAARLADRPTAMDACLLAAVLRAGTGAISV